jgi:hypothetical protein
VRGGGHQHVTSPCALDRWCAGAFDVGTVACMGRLGDPDWWWEYALDGVVGGVIGGLVTALAVWLTLRHERKLAAEATETTALATERAEARSMALQLQSSAAQVALSLEKMDNDAWTAGKGPSDPEVMSRCESLLEHALALNWLLANRWPKSSDEITQQADVLMDLFDAEEFPEEELDEAVTNLGLLASQLLQDADAVEAELVTMASEDEPRHKRGELQSGDG